MPCPVHYTWLQQVYLHMICLNLNSSWPFCLHVLALHLIASQTCCHQSVLALGALCQGAHLPCHGLVLPVAGSLRDGTPVEKPMLSITSTVSCPGNLESSCSFSVRHSGEAASIYFSCINFALTIHNGSCIAPCRTDGFLLLPPCAICTHSCQ